MATNSADIRKVSFTTPDHFTVTHFTSLSNLNKFVKQKRTQLPVLDVITKNAYRNLNCNTSAGILYCIPTQDYIS